MERIKKRLLAAVSVMAGMAMVMAIGFWTLRANAFARANTSGPVFHAAAVGLVTSSNVVRVVSATVTNQLPQSPPAGAMAPAAVPKIAVTPPPVAPAPVEENAGVLNLNRQFALGMIETANDDREIGHLGEVSRYQIMPSVWRRYSQSQEYRNPEVSVQVARQHWLALYRSFKGQTHREPTDFDMYVLWNTSYGYYASKNWQAAHVGRVVRDRAQRFANLVERGTTDGITLALK